MLYLKGVPFRASGMERDCFLRLEECEKGTFSGKDMWKSVNFLKFGLWKAAGFSKFSIWTGPDFPKVSMWKGKGSGCSKANKHL